MIFTRRKKIRFRISTLRMLFWLRATEDRFDNRKIHIHKRHFPYVLNWKIIWLVFLCSSRGLVSGTIVSTLLNYEFFLLHNSLRVDSEKIFWNIFLLMTWIRISRFFPLYTPPGISMKFEKKQTAFWVATKSTDTYYIIGIRERNWLLEKSKHKIGATLIWPFLGGWCV